MHPLLIAKRYRVWYRHNGEALIDCIPHHAVTTNTTVDEILRDVGSHYITHMYIESSSLPLLTKICPQLEQLKIRALPESDAQESERLFSM